MGPFLFLFEAREPYCLGSRDSTGRLVQPLPVGGDGARPAEGSCPPGVTEPCGCRSLLQGKCADAWAVPRDLPAPRSPARGEWDPPGVGAGGAPGTHPTGPEATATAILGSPTLSVLLSVPLSRVSTALDSGPTPWGVLPTAGQPEDICEVACSRSRDPGRGVSETGWGPGFLPVGPGGPTRNWESLWLAEAAALAGAL